MAEPGGWDETTSDLAARRAAARSMGGDERLARRRAEGKLDARARIEALVDPGSFVEIGTLVGNVPADAFVAGSGAVEGRPVMVGVEDFTVLGGSIGTGTNAKRHRIAELALRDRIPLVMMLEGAGYRTTERAHGRSPTDLLMQAQCSGRVPIVTAVLGPSAGHGALIAPMSDFTVMSEGAAIFTAGPPVVYDATGEEITKEELGGPDVALASGLVHNLARDDTDAIAQLRRYLSFFPSSAWSYPPTAAGADAGPRLLDDLPAIVPRDNRKIYDMRAVLDLLVDDGMWFEVQPRYGRAMLCALARLGGESVAIVANQPKIAAGAIDAEAANKTAHFITVADSFHVPLLFLADNPGMLPGSRSERAGVLRAGARMFAAQTIASTPKLHVSLRKAYGFGSMVMSMVSFDGQDATFAFPGATFGAMGASAAGRAIDADEEQTRVLRQRELQASYSSAAGLGFDELIDPRELRNALLAVMPRVRARRQVAAEPVARVCINP